MILSAIAAMGSNRVIGANGTLPWNLPEDMQFFRDKTMGHMMIMGRKTFESLGKPLPRRLHVVISRQANYKPAGAHVFTELSAAIQFCKSKVAEWGDEVFIIGGGQIYKEALPFTNKIYLTEIQNAYDGDAKFPEFDKSVFIEKQRRHQTPDPAQTLRYDFVTYERSI